MKRLLIGSLVVLVVSLLGGVIGFRFWLQAYLKSEPCRQRLNAAVSTALHSEAEFTPLQPRSLEAIYTDGFTARNGALFDLLKADQLRAEVRFGFFARSCTIENLDITRLRVTLPAGKPSANTITTQETIPHSPAAPKRGGASKFELNRLTVADFELNSHRFELRKNRLEISPIPGNAQEGWRVRGNGGVARLSAGPVIDWKVENFEGRSRNGHFYLTEANLRMENGGALQLQGDFSPDGSECQITYKALPIDSLLPPDWRAKLVGKLSGAAALALQGNVEIEKGEVILSEGELSALPLLDKIADVTRTDGFRRMNLHKGSARFSGDPAETIHVSDLLVESSGLLKIQGAFTIRAGEIDGTIQVGVIPSALEWIPGARERVFTTEREGYLWTPVKLSGPMAHPSEDLTSRLAAAAVDQTIHATKESVRKNAQEVLDIISPLVPLVPDKLPDKLPGLPFF